MNAKVKRIKRKAIGYLAECRQEIRKKSLNYQQAIQACGELAVLQATRLGIVSFQDQNND